MVDLSIAMLNYQRILSSELTPWPIEVEETRRVSQGLHISSWDLPQHFAESGKQRVWCRWSHGAPGLFEAQQASTYGGFFMGNYRTINELNGGFMRFIAAKIK